MSLPGIGVILEFPRQVLRTGTKATKNADEMLSKFQREIGKVGVKKVVETALTSSELEALKVAAEAVRSKQADVKDL